MLKLSFEVICNDKINIIITLFKKNNYEIYLVGGCVRDLLLNEIPDDYDMATNANPNQIVNILKDYKCNTKGIKYGIIQCQMDGIKMEIGSFRKDVDNEISFNATMVDDAMRRDITYNALYYDFDEKCIIDYVGGINDMNKRITKLINNPLIRLREDSLRILRVIRFAVKYDHKIDHETINAIYMSSLYKLPKERIYDEIKKVFKTKKFYEYLTLANSLNLFPQLFNNLVITFDKKIMSSNMCIYFAYMFKENNDIESKIKNLCFDNKLSNNVIFLIEYMTFNPEYIPYYIKKRRECNITNDILIEWINIMDLGMYQKRFILYKSVITKDIVTMTRNKNLKGKDFTDEITKIEYESFINFMKNSV